MYNIQSISIGHDGPVYYFWIPNFGSAYVVGDDGSVWSRYRPGPGSALLNDWKQLKATPDNEMYPQVILCYNRVKYSVKVHQLVCVRRYMGIVLRGCKLVIIMATSRIITGGI